LRSRLTLSTLLLTLALTLTIFLTLTLTESLKSIKNFANEVMAEKHIDYLILNAGVMAIPQVRVRVRVGVRVTIKVRVRISL
jgi:NAD(P)-dependent dehydrogenase (short-subunit alcohol dehydrogenase family)